MKSALYLRVSDVSRVPLASLPYVKQCTCVVVCLNAGPIAAILQREDQSSVPQHIAQHLKQICLLQLPHMSVLRCIVN
jgi:hypothetical protein